MDLYTKNNREPEKGEDVGSALIQLIEENLDTMRWGFRLVYTRLDQTSAIRIIYDSDWCRIKFLFSRQRISQHDELSILYGRSHALSEQPFMEWRGEQCRCWHNISEPLRFLDGLSPLEAAEHANSQEKSSHRMEDFLQSEIGQKLSHEYPPKAALVMHARIWEQYGQRLFELFDLRRPDLWEQYRSFLREYYRLTGMKSSWGPPYENVC